MIDDVLTAIPPTGEWVCLPRLYCLKSTLLLALATEHQTEAAICL